MSTTQELQRTIANAAAALAAVGEDGWITVAKVGRYPHRLGLQVVEPQDLEAVLANVEAAKNEQGENYTGFPLYPGHPDDPAAAALGWAKEWRISGDALQCRPEWNEEGRKALENKAWKHVSICWYCVPDEEGNLRPREIDHVGLTNRPAMADLPPIVNADSAQGDAGSGGETADSAGADAEPAAPDSHAEGPGVPDALVKNAGPWLDRLAEWIAEITQDAETPEQAAAVIEQRLEQLWEAQTALEQLLGIVRRTAEELGVERGEGGLPDADALLAAAANAAKRAAERDVLHRKLVERVVQNAAARGAVADTPEAREAAMRLAAADLEAAERLWSSAPAAPTRTPAPPEPPEDPVANARIRGGVPAVNSRQPSKEDLDKIQNAVQQRMNETGADYDSAHAWAFGKWLRGEL